MMFCNCNFHFFRGSYYTYYSGPEDGIILKYCTFKEYKFVDELTDLKHGAYIRWIPITNSDYLPLNQCGIVCDIKIADEGVFVVCKNFMHRHYNFKMDDVLIFQKLTNQELIILSALDHLDSNEDIKEIEKEDLEEDLEDEDLEEDD